MNLRLGRFGKQEAAAAVGLAALISGTFSVNVGETFARGNVSYAATAAGAFRSGAWGIAVVSAIMSAPDPRLAAEELLAAGTATQRGR